MHLSPSDNLSWCNENDYVVLNVFSTTYTLTVSISFVLIFFQEEKNALKSLPLFSEDLDSVYELGMLYAMVWLFLLACNNIVSAINLSWLLQLSLWPVFVALLLINYYYSSFPSLPSTNSFKPKAS